jgi:hypothetical protein
MKPKPVFQGCLVMAFIFLLGAVVALTIEHGTIIFK